MCNAAIQQLQHPADFFGFFTNLDAKITKNYLRKNIQIY